MSYLFFYNDAFYPNDQLVISHRDRGLLFADGLFETTLYKNNTLQEFDEHWQRLTNSARLLDIPCRTTRSECLEIIQTLIQKNNLSQAAVRITLTRGNNTSRGIRYSANMKSNLLITAETFTPPTKHLSVTISQFMRNEHSSLSRLKTTSYLEAILAKEKATKLGFDDALLINGQQHVVCATTANLFLIKGKTLCTAPIKSGILPGIMRQKIIALAKIDGIRVLEDKFSANDVYSADGLFISNSLIRIQPIARCDDRYYEFDLGRVFSEQQLRYIVG